MTKKDRYFNLRQAGHSHPEAASKAKLTNRQVRYKYGQEYEAFRKGWEDAQREAQARAEAEEQADLQEFRRAHPLPEAITAPQIPPSPISTLEPSQTRLGQNSTKKAQNDENRPPEINDLQTVQIDVIPSSKPIAQSDLPDPNPRNICGDPYGRHYFEDLAAREWNRIPAPWPDLTGTWSSASGLVLESDRQALAERIRREQEPNDDDF